MTDNTREPYIRWVVYGIADPRDHLVFYVGYTRSLPNRMRTHKVQPHSRSGERIKELASVGMSPQFVVLEECDREKQALRSEVFWIETFRSRGARLLNAPEQTNREASTRARHVQERLATFRPAQSTPPQKEDERPHEPAEKSERPKNSGQAWTFEEDRRLAELFNQSAEIDQLAAEFRRTPGAITSRLARMGLLETPTTFYSRRYQRRLKLRLPEES
jgi:predicted GIY-YIG superfamily endonuclease